MAAVVRAADRGVRVRMLIDDTDDVARDRRSGHWPLIQELKSASSIRYTRGMLELLRYAEFVVAGQRVNYRMRQTVRYGQCGRHYWRTQRRRRVFPSQFGDELWRLRRANDRPYREAIVSAL
jgi:phosphatidylserine/phosphatidylglycerophosphate/cardiolipin synthase-like enzyme